MKKAHIAFALISVGGFTVRWIWKMKGSALATRRLTRIAPHVIDTLFLISGIVLAITLGQFPFEQNWLTAKVVGLVAYILCGMAAMSDRNSRSARTIWFLIALTLFSWIISVAYFKTFWGYFSAIA